MNDLKKRNIIHRDLKLENILIKNNEVKIINIKIIRLN
jgi:serine/threonine protein kinase